MCKKVSAEKPLTHPPQAKAGHGDSQLGGAQKGIEIRQDVPRHFRPAQSPEHQRIELRFPDADQSELRGDKKAVEQNQAQNEQDFPKDLKSIGGVMHDNWSKAYLPKNHFQHIL